MEKIITPISGPLAGLFGAVLGLVVSKKGHNTALRQVGLALAISLSFTTFQYYLRSANRIGGDEYTFAMQLGIPPALPNILFGAAFTICLILALSMLSGWLGKLKWLGTVVLGNAITGVAMFFGDDLVISQVNMGNPWFRPIFGYVLPVFLVNSLAAVGVVVWYKYQHRKNFSRIVFESE